MPTTSSLPALSASALVAAPPPVRDDGASAGSFDAELQRAQARQQAAPAPAAGGTRDAVRDGPPRDDTSPASAESSAGDHPSPAASAEDTEGRDAATADGTAGDSATSATATASPDAATKRLAARLAAARAAAAKGGPDARPADAAAEGGEVTDTPAKAEARLAADTPNAAGDPTACPAMPPPATAAELAAAGGAVGDDTAEGRLPAAGTPDDATRATTTRAAAPHQPAGHATAMTAANPDSTTSPDEARAEAVGERTSAISIGHADGGGALGATTAAAGEVAGHPAWAAAWGEANATARADGPAATGAPGLAPAGNPPTIDDLVGSAGFAPALGARLVILARDGVEQAQLHVNPAELGPIALRLALDGPLVRVEMSAEAATTRQALEDSLPALASALQDSGFTLAGGGVFQQASQQQQAPARDPQDPRATTGTGADRETGRDAMGDASPPRAARARRVDGLIDVFA